MTVSLLTTCMGRLHHLRRTLLPNLAACELPDTEVLVLDYGSRDGLRNWIETDDPVRRFVGRRLTIVRMVEPPTLWRANHAKNVAALCARGDVVVNVDADNFVGAGFDRTARDLLSTGGAIAVPGRSRARCAAGRIGLRLVDFVELGGYDEEMKNWGYTDADLRVRANRSGLESRAWPDAKGSATISHDDDERLEHGDASNKSESYKANVARSLANIHAGRLRANVGRRWGEARVVVDEVKERTVGILQD